MNPNTSEMKLQEIYRVSLMPSKADYKQIIKNKLSQEKRENQEEASAGDTGENGVDSVSTKDKLH